MRIVKILYLVFFSSLFIWTTPLGAKTKSDVPLSSVYGVIDKEHTIQEKDVASYKLYDAKDYNRVVRIAFIKENASPPFIITKPFSSSKRIVPIGYEIELVLQMCKEQNWFCLLREINKKDLQHINKTNRFDILIGKVNKYAPYIKNYTKTYSFFKFHYAILGENTNSLTNTALSNVYLHMLYDNSSKQKTLLRAIAEIKPTLRLKIEKNIPDMLQKMSSIPRNKQKYHLWLLDEPTAIWGHNHGHIPSNLKTITVLKKLPQEFVWGIYRHSTLKTNLINSLLINIYGTNQYDKLLIKYFSKKFLDEYFYN